MTYAIFILRRAQKELSGLPHESYTRVRDAIRRLADEPRPGGSKKLTGRAGWRIRVGSYRVVYEVADQARVVTIMHIGHRRDVYRQLPDPAAPGATGAKAGDKSPCTRSPGRKGDGMVVGSLLRRVAPGVLFLCAVGGAGVARELPEPKPVPRLQVIPMPYDQASFRRDGVEITRYHFGPSLHRPFLYPVIGPSGRNLTRMGHPHDPESHSHHNSVWISHHDVAGVNFWGDRGGGTIRHKRIVEYVDEGQRSSIVAENEWVDADGKVLLNETRTVTVLLLGANEWLLVLDMQLGAKEKPVRLGKTPFGMIGVRMAKTIGVNDGGGRIRNSEGDVNEKEVFWKRARWVDYSGAIKDGVLEGVTLFDHPDNPNHPSHFHVRNDGWIGASLTFDGPREISPDEPLNLRYGLYVHAGMKSGDVIDAVWNKFSEIGSF